MIQKAIKAIEEFMAQNPEMVDAEQMIDLDDNHSVVFALGSEGEFARYEADPPYFLGEITVYPRFAFLMRFDHMGMLQEQTDIKNKIAHHIERA